MIIDFTAHHVPKSVQQMREQKTAYVKGKQFDSSYKAVAEVRLRLMEKYGIDVQALSLTTPILYPFSLQDAAEVCRLSNSGNYALCKEYPGKFVNICVISLLDMESAMEELDRAINELDCRAIIISTNQKGKGLDSPEYFPFYEKLVEHDLPLYIHPTNWESYSLVDMEQGWRMMHVFGWPFDTTQAMWRLIFGGVIDRFPSLKIVTHHLGGMFPYFAKRMETISEAFFKEKLPRPISEYWAHFYGDTAMDGTVAAYPCGYAFFGPDRMVFGTDYPFSAEEGEKFIRENLAGVKAMTVPADHLEKILGGNARKLLKIQ